MTVHESARETSAVEYSDVVVCGGGPAGIAAAVAAARSGARTSLLEVHGCLGGVWTAGALSWILEADKKGILSELTHILDRREARALDTRRSFGYDVEVMKQVLDDLALDSGVRVQLHTRVVAALTDSANRVTHVITESKSGRQAWPAEIFVDATGDGDVAAQAGCGYDYGHPASGLAQPMTLMGLLTGIHVNDVDEFVAGGIAPRSQMPRSTSISRYKRAKDHLMQEFGRASVAPSYTAPALWCIYEDLFALMANHEYNVSAMDAEAITQATMNARSELHGIVTALRSLGGRWQNVRLVATGAQIGVREGRRIHGRYSVNVDDLRRGAHHDDAVCHVESGADVHALSRDEGGYLSRATDVLQDPSVATNEVAPVRPYDIPLRALVARDVDGLLLAGRCISGDFLAHASYRVTGNAVAMGQAAGAVAALSAESGLLPHDIAWVDAKRAIDRVVHLSAQRIKASQDHLNHPALL